jgi:hypothetical protein
VIASARRALITWRAGDAFTVAARRPSSILGAAALALAIVYSYAIVDSGGDVLLVVPLVAAVITVAVFAHPSLGLYLLFGAAILFEQFGVEGLLPITSMARFFQNISAYTPIPLRLSTADLLVLLTVASWSLRVVDGRLPKPRMGPFGWPVAGFGLMFLAGAVFGVARGGGFDLDAALAELRAPMHLCVAYFLAANLIRERRQLEILVWEFALIVGIKAFQGILNYQDAANLPFDVQAVTGHEDVVFFGLALALAAAMLGLGVRSRLSVAVLAVQPFILVTLVLTERRVGFIGLGVGLVLVTILTFAADRRRAVVLAAVLSLAAGAYIVAFWDASGAVAEPVRAVRGVVDPSSVSRRDEQSNGWRDIENRNIARTVREFPLTGVGLGQQYLIVEEPPRLLGFTYWRYMTHNALLWIWLKTGPLGEFAFWLLVARVLLLGGRWYAKLRDSGIQWAAAIPVVLISTQVIFSAVELGLTYSRTMIVLGAMLGLAPLLRGMVSSRLAARPAS